ncbi:MAG: hypothetical protein RQ833_08950 [Sphingomonadaceae bacterium]|nr:hypothetical protein [Sphingomonadaceae bacterium]
MEFERIAPALIGPPTVGDGDGGGPGDPVVISSFGRSGTHLTIDLIRRQFPAFASWKWPGECMSALYCRLDAAVAGSAPPAAELRALRRAPRPIIKTHHWLEWLGAPVNPLMSWVRDRGTVIHAVRDPVAVLPSIWALNHTGAARGLGPPPPAPEFVRHEAAAWARQTCAILDRPPPLVLPYEDILADPLGTTLRIAALLNEAPALCDPLLPAAWTSLAEARWARIISIRPRSTAILASRRIARLKPFRWTPELRALLADGCGAEMRALGYDAREPGLSL